MTNSCLDTGTLPEGDEINSVTEVGGGGKARRGGRGEKAGYADCGWDASPPVESCWFGQERRFHVVLKVVMINEAKQL